MVQTPEALNLTFRTIRKTLQLSLHDCANILGISKDHFLAFEQGTGSLSLPELEILALYFGVPLAESLQGQPLESERFHLLEDPKRLTYKQLREKWIRSRLILERQHTGLSLEALSEALAIPVETLKQYEQGDANIPLEHLQLIGNHLGLSLEAFFPENMATGSEDEQATEPVPAHWNPEFPNTQNATEESEDPYGQLLAALKKIPEEDQAQIAKILLNKLKSI